MAGSENHILTFTIRYIDNLGDAHESLEECLDESHAHPPPDSGSPRMIDPHKALLEIAKLDVTEGVGDLRARYLREYGAGQFKILVAELERRDVGGAGDLFTNKGKGKNS